MSTEPNDGEYNRLTAIFWGCFADEPNHQEAHCPTISLYQNENGKFFAMRDRRTGPNRDLPTNPTHAIPGTVAELIKDVGEWLKERAEFIEKNSKT